jgi:hypothetical protein
VKILQGDNPVRSNSAAWLNKVVDGRRTWKQRSAAHFAEYRTNRSHPKLQPLRHSRLNNHPVGQKNDEKHSFDWSFNRVRKTEKPMRYWPCQKLLSLKRADLHVVKTWSPTLPPFPPPSLRLRSLARSVRSSRTRIRVLDPPQRYRYRNSLTAGAESAEAKTNRRLVSTAKTLVKSLDFM